MLLHNLQKRKLINPPLWLCDNTHYMTISGSHAYGVADTHVSSNIPDYDYYGFCIPPKEYVFPHQVGCEIEGFGTKKSRFEQFQIIGVEDSDSRKEYDFQIFSIVKFFELCRGCNPNLIDTLFTPFECITHITPIGQMVRDNRKLFLSKLAFHRFRGYAFSQIKKCENTAESEEVKNIRKFEDANNLSHNITSKDLEQEISYRNSGNPDNNITLVNMTNTQLLYYKKLFDEGNSKSKRFESRKIYHQDNKFLYHIVRLLDECEQILESGDLDLRRSKEVMKAVRRGEWTLEQIQEWLVKKDQSLEDVYNKSALPYSAPEDKLKELLLNCLEHHYGSLKEVYTDKEWSINSLKEIDSILEKHRNVLYK